MEQFIVLLVYLAIAKEINLFTKFAQILLNINNMHRFYLQSMQIWNNQEKLNVIQIKNDSILLYIQIKFVIIKQNMEINQRELALQKIIKTQQTQIIQLQIKLADNLSIQKVKLQTRIRELQSKLNIKEKECQRLENFVKQLQSQIKSQKNVLHQSQKKDKYIFNLQSKQLSQKIRDLEQKLKNQIEKNEEQVNKLLKINQSLQKEINLHKSYNSAIEIQIQKLQIFYRSATSELPKRIDTLNWVENLIKFMNQYEDNIEKHPIKQQILTIKSDIQNYIKQFEQKKGILMEQHQTKVNLLKKIKDDITTIISNHNKHNEQVINQNNKIWDMIKKQQVNKKTEYNKNVQQQFNNYRIQTEKEIKQFNKKIQENEKEKKQLIAGFQQLKSYYQNRQKSLKQQNRLLKQAESRLIQYGEKRQINFENQMKVLTNEVELLTKKFDQNITIPFQEYQTKLIIEIKSLISTVKDLDRQDKFLEFVNKLEQKYKEIEIFFKKYNENQNILLSGVENNISVLETIRRNLNIDIHYIIETIETYSKKNMDVDEIEKYYNFKTLQLQSEQKDQRKGYQINILKKNYAKLIEINTKLQQKISKNQFNKEQIIPTQKVKMMQLQTQNQILSNLKSKYQNKFMVELKRLKFMKYDQQIITTIAQNLQRFQISLSQIEKICKDGIIELSKSESNKSEQYIIEINEVQKQIKQLISNPFKKLENFLNLRNKLQESKTMTKNIENSQKKQFKTQLNLNFKSEVKQFKEILTHRNQAKFNINKSINQLIAKIKSNISLQQKLEDSMDKSLKKSTIKAEQNMQRRLRDIQTLRIKQKADINATLDKLNAIIKKIDTNKLKSDKYFQGLHRIQQLLKQKIEMVITFFENMTKDKKIQELTQIAKKAITDLEAKLKESIIQNEGLMKQLKLAQIFGANKIKQNKQIKQIKQS